jgi:guanosine-3',5'-bis(diphosphate) 3'-pyrophosphohydrolase
VADLVWASGGTELEIIGAWLHDCVEDTQVTFTQIESIFGIDVREIVMGLTDKDELNGLSNAERKPLQAERVKNESSSIRRIKLADQISNIRFVTTDPKPSWTFESNRDYVIGAKLIANQCRGISTVLDELFDSEYTKATVFFKI